MLGLPAPELEIRQDRRAAPSWNPSGGTDDEGNTCSVPTHTDDTLASWDDAVVLQSGKLLVRTTHILAGIQLTRPVWLIRPDSSLGASSSRSMFPLGFARNVCRATVRPYPRRAQLELESTPAVRHIGWVFMTRHVAYSNNWC